MDICHNIVTHISIKEGYVDKMENDTLLPWPFMMFFVGMMTMWTHSILKDIKNRTCHLIIPFVLHFLTLVFHFSDKNHAMLTRKNEYF